MLDVRPFCFEQERASNRIYKGYFETIRRSESSFTVKEVVEKIAELKLIKAMVSDSCQVLALESNLKFTDILHIDLPKKAIPSSSMIQEYDLEIPVMRARCFFPRIALIHKEVKSSMTVLERKAILKKNLAFAQRFLKSFEFIERPYKVIKSVKGYFKLPEEQRVYMPEMAVKFFAENCLRDLSVGARSLLGRGGYGSVDLVKIGQTFYAQKTLHLNEKGPEILKQLFIAETAMNMLIPSSAHLVSLAAIFEDKMFLEFAGSNTISDWVASERTLQPKQLTKYFLSIAKGVAVLHHAGFNHNDLKPNNFLFNEETDEAKLADFGLSRISRLSRNFIRTIEYMAPEVLDPAKAITTATDIWAFGMSLIEVMTKARIQFVSGASFEEKIQEMREYLGVRYMIPATYRNTFLDLPVEQQYFIRKQDPKNMLQHVVVRCLHGDPAKRINVDDLIEKLEAILLAYN